MDGKHAGAGGNLPDRICFARLETGDMKIGYVIGDEIKFR